jgi:hypothetical protein
MWEFVWSPIPLVINFLLLLALSTPVIAGRKWANIGRVLIISLLSIQIVFMIIGFSDKLR